jgi:nuclear protein 1
MEFVVYNNNIATLFLSRSAAPAPRAVYKVEEAAVRFQFLFKRQIERVRQIPCVISKMSEAHFDEYEHYNFEVDKHIYSGHSGKQRTKKEASEHTNHNDPGGHSRKILTKIMNTENNRKTKN